MHFLKNDKGYSLLFTLCTLVLITILGVGLITLSSTGLMRNESRENVALANDLSEKGIQYMSNKINKDLKQHIVKLKSGTTTVDNVFNEILLAYGCTSNNSKDIIIDGTNGKTSVCIESIENQISAKENQRRNTRLVTLRSTGEAAASKKAGSRTIVEFGFSDIPEQLSYAVSSNEKGNIYFFGGTEIRGNIKLSGDMYVSDKAFYSNIQKPVWVNSVPPKIISHEANKSAIIYSNKNQIYKFKTMPGDLSNINVVNSGNTIQFSSQTDAITNDKLDETFTGTKPIVRKYTQESQPFIIHKKPKGYESTPSKFEEMNALPSSSKDIHNGAFSRTSDKSGSHTVANNKVFHVKDKTGEKGNMYIGRYAKEGSSDNPNNYYDFSLSGNYYVDGDVYIKGAKLKSNAVIYTKGKVEIAYSTIEPLNNGTLFIFADGGITINNISVDSLPGKGSIINGYFYTNQDFLMYGVGSNTTITGGLSARNITYTALRGNAQGKGLSVPYKVPNHCEPFNLSCIEIQTQEQQLNLNISQENKNKITSWMTMLQHKVTGISKLRYVDEHSLSYWTSITNNELESIKMIINNPNAVKPEHLTAIEKINVLANAIPSNMRSFNYTSTRLNSISKKDVKAYAMIKNDQSVIEQSLKTLYNYAIAKLVNDCKNNKNYSCLSIISKYANNDDKGYKTSDSIENQLNQPSRLTIIYDRELVTRYRKTTEDDMSAVQDLTIFKQKVHAMEPF